MDAEKLSAQWRVHAAASLAAGLVLLCAVSAHAHTRSVSYSSWELEGGTATVTLRIPQLELTRLPWGPVLGGRLDPRLATYLTSRLQLLAGGEACTVVAGPTVLAGPPERAALEWRIECAGGPGDTIRSRVLHETAPSHLHFARLSTPTGEPLERVLTIGEPSWTLPTPAADDTQETASHGSSLRSYLALGIEHIGTGPDHLAFVLALILIAARLGEVATVITGFTIAHSLTLAIAVLGLAKPESREIGALVGLSIALVAAENAFLLSGRRRAIAWVAALGLAGMAGLAAFGLGVLGAMTLAGMALFTGCYFGLLGRAARPARLRVAISFVFGLVHGFGFAGVLVDLDLPTPRLAPALLGFNAGVEIGQFVLVVALWPILRDIARLDGGRPHRWVVEAGSAALCALGLFWFLTRVFG